jgi:hypothetical protein
MTSCAATDGQCSINLSVSEQSKQPVVVVSDPSLMRHKGQNLIPYAASRITCSLNGSRNSEPNPWSCRLVLRGTLPQHRCGTALSHGTVRYSTLLRHSASHDPRIPSTIYIALIPHSYYNQPQSHSFFSHHILTAISCEDDGFHRRIG